MLVQTIFFFVERIYDQLFLEQVIIPYLKQKEEILDIKIILYSQLSKQDVRKKLNSISKYCNNENAVFFILVDSDFNNNLTSILKVKQNFMAKYNLKTELFSLEQFIVVIIEIESWYLAGLSPSKTKSLRLPYIQDTENAQKEQMISKLKKFQDNPTLLYSEILSNYDLNEALQRNNSFLQFILALDNLFLS